MNTRKQVLIMSGLLMMMLIIVAIYAAWYPSRATNAESKFEEDTANRGAMTFARNCRLCHGDVGQGGALGGRLPAAPALNRPDLQGFTDANATIQAELTPDAKSFQVSDASKLKNGQTILIDQERMQITALDGNTLNVDRGYGNTEAAGHFTGAKVFVFDAAALKDKVKLITNTITCGRVGTAMPAWAETQGGPLSDEQIRQLMVLITTGRWDLVQEEVNKEDKIDVHLTQPLSADASSSFVDAGTSLTAQVDDSANTIQVGDGSKLPLNGEIMIDAERMRVNKIEGNTITVLRGADHTTPAAHSSGAAIKKFQGAELHVSDVTRFSTGDVIRMGDERLRLIEVPAPKNGDKSGVLKVERAVLNSSPVDHPLDTIVYKFPEAPDPASINQSSCGQTAQAPAPAGTPATIEPFDGQTVNVVAKNISYDTNKIEVNSGGKVRVRLDNQDSGVQHNIAFYKSSTDTTAVSSGSVGLVFAGVAVDDTAFDVPAKGTYYFRCDIHPTIMNGTFVVN